MKNNIGDKVRKIRELKGFPQEWVTSKLDCSQRAYSKIERNEVKIDWGKITNISEVLSIDPIDLISFDDNLTSTAASNRKFGVFNNKIADTLNSKYEDHIKSLEDEIVFLRKLLEEKYIRPK